MKLLCPISGISYHADTFNALSISSIHPIFSLAPEQLSRLAEQHRRHKLTKQESRLLCLALWHSTQLVTFNEPVQSSQQALQAQEASINKAIPLLLEFHTFLESRNKYQRGLAHFPRIIASNANTYDLSIIPESCTLWNEAIQEYYSSYHAARNSLIEAEKQNFLSHLSAFSTRKPKRYIAAIANYIIDSLPAAVFPTRQEREHARYIITYAGIVHTIDTRPSEPITKQEIESLIELIIANFDLDNIHIWKGFKVLEQFLASGHYSAYGVSMLSSAESEQAEAEKQARKTAIMAELGPRPDGFLAGIQYDAKMIQLLSNLDEGPSMSAIGNKTAINSINSTNQ